MEEEEHFEIRDDTIEPLLQKLGHGLMAELPEGWGFALWLYTYGEKGSCFYVSSGQRAQMLAALREFLAREEGRCDPVPNVKAP